MRQNQSLKQEQGHYGERLEVLVKKGEALHSQAVYEVFATLFGRLFRKKDLGASSRGSHTPMRERVSH